MKTINTKMFYLFLWSLLLLQSCMPDSLTKFKQSTPKAQVKSVGVVVTDPTGAIVPAANIVYPTFAFFTIGSSVTQVTNWNLKVGQTYTETTGVHPITDADFKNSNSFLRCELDVTGAVNTRTLPTGMTLDQTSCDITGTPTIISSDLTPGLIGNPIAYTANLFFKNGKNLAAGVYGAVTCTAAECYIKTNAINIGAYKIPANFKTTQSDKLGLKLGDFAGSTTIGSFKVDDSNFSTRSDVITTSVGAMASIQIVDSSKDTIYIQRSVPLTVASTAGFTAGAIVGTYDSLTFASNPGFVVGNTIGFGTYSGVMNSISFSAGVYTVNVFRDATSGSVLAPGSAMNVQGVGATPAVTTVTLVPPVRGTLLAVGTNLLRVTQYPSFNNLFAATNPIAVQNSSNSTTITSIDIGDGFRNLDTMDNDTQFYLARAKVKDTTSFYAVANTIDSIIPYLGTNDSLYQTNGVVYSISPALPAGLSFNPVNGYISGSFTNETAPTTYTITATNSLGSVSHVMILSAIYPPQDLSYTNNQIIFASNAAASPISVFNEGEEIFQPIVAPATESVRGRIKRKISTNVLSIENYNGTFQPGASIDSGRSYVAEKAYISSIANSYSYNVALYVASTASFAIGNYVSSSSNALGKVIYIDATLNILYVQFLTPNIAITPITFKQGDSIDNVATYVGAETTISKIEATAYKLTLNTAVDFTAGKFDYGQDITTTDGTSTVSGFIFDIDSAGQTINIDNVTKTPSPVNASNVVTSHYPEFVIGQTIDYKERYSAPSAILTAVTHDNSIIINRGESIVLNPNYTQGTNLTFAITPSLPIGISMNTATGVVSGKATYLTTKKDYIITAKNLLGSSSFKFSMEVRDSFSIADGSDSSSFVLHKVGDTQNTRGCKISASDILNNRGNLDIRCFLDGQEEDFYFNKLKFKTLVGSGVCEYIQYAPFSFQQFKPNFTPRTVGSVPNEVNVISGCTTSADNSTPAWVPALGGYQLTAPSTTNATSCPANYTIDDPKYPNCDESEYVVHTITASRNSTTGVCTVDSNVPTTFKCGGNKHSCVKGAIQDILTDAQIKGGARSMIYSTSSGSSVPTLIHKSPGDFGDYSNLRVVNSTRNNQCTSTNAHTNNWEDYIKALNTTAYLLPAGAAKTTAFTVNPFINAIPVYTFNCLDAAYDIKARIRVYTRDWDRTFKITDHIDLDNPDAILNPDRMNVVGLDPFGVSYNRYEDWDNNYSGLGSANYTNACTAPGSMPGGASTEYAFPEDNI